MKSGELMSDSMQISKPTVAVVENNASSRRIFERSAEELGIELLTFSSAEESLDYLNDNKPELLFLNILMPDKDGLTFLRELRNNPIHSETPVVMITSKDYAQDRSVAKELGAIEFITKPVPIQVITDVVTKHTGAPQANAK